MIVSTTLGPFWKLSLFFLLFITFGYSLERYFLVYYFNFQLVFDWKTYRTVKPYFTSIWNIVELINLIVSFRSIISLLNFQLFLIGIALYAAFVLDPSKNMLNFSMSPTLNYYPEFIEVLAFKATLSYQVQAFSRSMFILNLTKSRYLIDNFQNLQIPPGQQKIICSVADIVQSNVLF